MRGWSSKEITDPRGAWTLVSEVRKGTPSRAFTSQNVRFSPGKVFSREGTSPVFSSSGKVTSMYNWISPTQQDLVLYQDGTSVKQIVVADSSISTLLTGLNTTRAVSFSDLGPRIYMAAYDTSGNGTTQARVYDGATAFDICFRGPLTFTAFTAADGGVGECTIGTHKIGMVFQSRSGFSGQPSPAPANVFTPASVTLNGTNRTIHVSITLNTPSDAGLNSAFYPIMTRADNPNEWYFVPNQIAVLPASTNGWTVTFDLSVSDEDLATSANSAQNQFNLLTATVGGTGPISPSVVRAYGKRMTYLVQNQVYVSDIDDPQAISADLNVVTTQNERLIATTFPLGVSFYMTGDRWTARVTDNGDSPSTWPQAETVSDSIGTTAQEGVEWRTAGQYAWVAAETGLFLFTGTFPPKPITYLWSDQWKLINWAAAYAIKVVDDVVNQKVYVAAPMGAATEPTQMFVIDYTNGLTYDSCDISVDAYNFATFSSICRVKEYASARTGLWIGPSAAGSVLRQDTTTPNDNGAAIHSIWESGFIRGGGEFQSQFIRVGGAHFWLSGSGTISHTWYNRNRTWSAAPPGFTLSASPSQPYFTKFDFRLIDNYSVRLEQNAVGASWSLSMIKPYAKPDLYIG